MAFSGVKWNTIGNITNVITNFAIGIILARLLTPTDYGIVGVYGVFFAIASVVINGGFSMAIIHKQNLTQEDCSTAFWYNVFLGLLFYGLFYTTSPLFAAFFNIPVLKDVLRVTALGLIIGAFTTVQRTLFVKKIDFKTISLINLSCNVLSGVTGIALAYAGYGVWALVFMGLVNGIISTICLWHFSKWRPHFLFSKKSFSSMFSYGNKILGTRLLETTRQEVSSFIIGKFFSTRELGLFTKGVSNSKILSTNISDVLCGVTFPVLSKIQDDDKQLISVYHRMIRLSSMVIFFLMLLLAVLAHPIIVFLYSDKWEGAVIFMQIISFSLMFEHINVINNNIFNVKGRSDILFTLEIVKCIIFLSLLLISTRLGIIALCMAMVVYTQIALILNTWQTKKLLNFGYWSQVKDFFPYIFLSAISVLPAYLISQSQLPNIAIIILGATLSLIAYIFTLLLIKDDVFNLYIWNHHLVLRLRRIIHR
jgi:O-antigen/teichoic acid export membrane protein